MNELYRKALDPMQSERTWSEHFIWHIRQIPFQIHHMRELTENTVSAQDPTADRVSGTSEKARLPYRVDPADDADLLYAALVIFARVVAQRIGGSSPRALRERMWNGRDEPQGLPLCTPSEAFALASEITLWLEACAHQIAHDGELHDEPEYLTDLTRKYRARYPRAEPKFKAYRPRPCPTCGERTIEPLWGINGLDGARCDNCGEKWVHITTDSDSN